MKKLFSGLNKILEGVAGLCTISFTVLVFAQVIARYVFKSPFHWQEEICMYLFLLLVLCGSILSMRNKGHITVDLIDELLPPAAKKGVDIVVQLLTLAACAYYTYSGYMLCTNVGNRLSGELRIPMRIIYAFLPAAGAFMCVYALMSLVETIKKGREGDA